MKKEYKQIVRWLGDDTLEIIHDYQDGFVSSITLDGDEFDRVAKFFSEHRNKDVRRVDDK